MIPISMPGSPIERIYVYAPLHGQSEIDGYFTVRLNTKDEQVIRRVIALAGEVGVTLRKTWISEGVTLKSKDISLLREFSNKLLDINLISSDDRYELQSAISKVDEVLRNRPNIIQRATISQKDILKEIASPYIEALVEDTHSFGDIIPIISYAILGDTTACDEWKEWLENQSNPNSADKIAESIDCMKYLSMLVCGEADLSSTFMRLGIGIPSLELQRQVIIEAIQETFVEKYGAKRSNSFEEFYLELALDKLSRGMSPRRHLSYSFLISWVNGFPESYSSKRVTINGSQISSVAIYEDSFVPTEEEKIILRKHGLKRFPTSLEDMNAAKADLPGEIIENPRELRKLIDVNLYPHMTSTEQLYCAIVDDESGEIPKILSTSSDDIKHLLFGGGSPIMLAARKGAVKSLQKLIELGVDLNYRSELGETALHDAAISNQLPSIRILLDHHAIFSVNNRGSSPLHYLFFQNNTEISTQDIVEMIQLLMRAGSITSLDDHFDNSGENCLHMAARVASRNSILALLEVGASPFKKSVKGLSAYDLIFTRPLHPLNKDQELKELMS